MCKLKSYNFYKIPLNHIGPKTRFIICTDNYKISLSYYTCFGICRPSPFSIFRLFNHTSCSVNNEHHFLDYHYARVLLYPKYHLAGISSILGAVNLINCTTANAGFVYDKTLCIHICYLTLSLYKNLMKFLIVTILNLERN